MISQPEKPYERQNTGVWFACDITADGRSVVYTRSSGHDPDHIVRHLYRYDATTGLTTPVVPGDLRGTIDRVDASAVPSISADGRYVGYLQSTPTDPTTFLSTFTLTLLDTTTGAKQRIATSDPGYANLISNPSVSDNGRYVAYSAVGHGSEANREDVYRYDSHTGVSTLVSRTPGGARPDDSSGQPRISGDGRYVAYISSASDIVPGAHGLPLVYVYDTDSGTTDETARDRQGALLNGGNHDDAYLPYIDKHGDTVAFVSQSRKLVAGLPATHLERVFVWTR